MRRSIAIAHAAALLGLAAQAHAQASAAPPAAPPAPVQAYGSNITLEQAKQVVAAGEAEAARRKLPITIAVVDTAGDLVFFEKATNAAGTAETFAMKKAVAAVKKRAPTIADIARIKGGDPAALYVPELFPFPGGYPIVVDGKVIGALGETGGADDDVAKAAAMALR